MTLITQAQWTDGLFDLAFAEDHPDIILTASGDGGIQLWDLKTPEVIKELRSFIVIHQFYVCNDAFYLMIAT